MYGRVHGTVGKKCVSDKFSLEKSENMQYNYNMSAEKMQRLFEIR